GEPVPEHAGDDQRRQRFQGLARFEPRGSAAALRAERERRPADLAFEIGFALRVDRVKALEATVAQEGDATIGPGLDDERVPEGEPHEPRGRDSADVHHRGIEARALQLLEGAPYVLASRDRREDLGPPGIAAEHGEGDGRVVELERYLALQLERDGRGEASRIGEGQAEDPV